MPCQYLAEWWCDMLGREESWVRYAKTPECSTSITGGKHRWSRELLRWFYSEMVVVRSGITHNTPYIKAEETFTLLSPMAQLKCTREFQSINDFSSSAKTVGGGQVTWERDQCAYSHLKCCIFHWLWLASGWDPSLWGEAYLISVLYSSHVFLQCQKTLLLLIAAVHTVERIFSEGQIGTVWCPLHELLA